MKRGVIIGVVASVLLIVAITLLVLSNNQTNTPSKTTLSVWSPFDEGKTFQTISAKYLTAHPNVTLDFKYVAASDAKDYEAQVVNAIANGKGPDIWLLRNDWLPKHISKLKPATLNNSTAAAIREIKKGILPNLVDQNTKNGALYALPLQADALAIIYNQTLYNSLTNNLNVEDQKIAQTVPGSWEELKKQVQLITSAKSGVVTRSGMALGTYSNTFAATDVLSAFLVQSGVTDVLAADSKLVAFNLPKIVSGATTLPATEALSFYTSFASPSAPNFSWTENLGDPMNAFMNQKTVALVGYYSTLQAILNRKPSFNVNVAPLVQMNPTATSPRVDYGVTWSGAVNKNSSHASTAWGYLSSLGSTAALQQYATATNRLDITDSSITTASLQPQLVSSSTAASLYQKELPTVTSLSTPEWQFRDQVLADTINLVINSSQSAQTAVDSAAARFKAQFVNGQ